MLGLALASWNTLMLVSLGLAALAALAIFITSRAVIVLQDQEVKDNAEIFERYKLETGERISEANARQKEAELKLEQLRKQMGPRQAEVATFLKALEGKPKAPVEIMFPKEDGEAFMLALQFRDLLRSAKWEVAEPVPVPGTDIPRLANQPSHMAAGAQAIGVAVVVRADTQDEFDRVSDFNADTPMNALRDALAKTLGGVAGYAAGPDIFPAPPKGTVRIVVGPKP